MALQITAWETRYEVANKLSNIDVEFISLVPQAANGESFTLVKSADKTAKNGERNTVMNPSMRPDQKMLSCLYKMQASLEKSHEVVKSLLNPKQVKPTNAASPRVNGAVERLQAQLAELNKQVQMLTADQKSESVFVGAFTRNPGKSSVQKSVVEPSIFSSAFAPRDLTEIAKAAEREGYWPLSIKHEGPGTMVIKSSTLCLGDHEEVHVPLKKSADTDMDVFAGAFPRL